MPRESLRMPVSSGPASWCNAHRQVSSRPEISIVSLVPARRV